MNNNEHTENERVCRKISTLIGLIEMDKLEFQDSMDYLKETGKVYDRYKTFYVANVERDMDFMNAMQQILQHIYNEYGCTPSDEPTLFSRANRPLVEKEIEDIPILEPPGYD